jgi:hypothetical protein
VQGDGVLLPLGTLQRFATIFVFAPYLVEGTEHGGEAPEGRADR